MSSDQQVFHDTDYVIEVKGVGTVPIDELSREQLIQELKKAIDILEDLDTIAENAVNRIKVWRFNWL